MNCFLYLICCLFRALSKAGSLTGRENSCVSVRDFALCHELVTLEMRCSVNGRCNELD